MRSSREWIGVEDLFYLAQNGLLELVLTATTFFSINSSPDSQSENVVEYFEA